MTIDENTLRDQVPDPPDAPVNWDSERASAWGQGWSSGYEQALRDVRSDVLAGCNVDLRPVVTRSFSGRSWIILHSGMAVESDLARTLVAEILRACDEADRQNATKKG